jgi:lipopolysaccharide transport system ATP-binding protein
MSCDIAVSVRNVSKVYRIYDRPEHRLVQMATLGRVRPFTEFSALHDVSLEVRRGETVGSNGCGKSTLLQMICGILQPTQGSVSVQGRIAALLELGAGFNGEFTGRENVYMNGAILGFSREEMDARFEQIAQFAGIGDFIERPVKTYSSGMFVRLAFSVATAVEPDILIVDEALAVGDEGFQRKCYSRIEAIKERGGTILFVSHGAQTIVQLCDRAVLLDAGEKLLEGEPKPVVSQYQRLVNLDDASAATIRAELKALGAQAPHRDGSGSSSSLEGPERIAGGKNANQTPAGQPTLEWLDPNIASNNSVMYESNGATIQNAKISTLEGIEINVVRSRARYRFSYDVTFDRDCRNVGFGMLIKTVSGLELGGADSYFEETLRVQSITPPADYHVEVEFDCNLTAGTYFINAGVHGTVGENTHYLHRILDVLAFRVLPDTQAVATSLVNFDPSIAINRTDEREDAAADIEPHLLS